MFLSRIPALSGTPGPCGLRVDGGVGVTVRASFYSKLPVDHDICALFFVKISCEIVG